jgi:hypothetical protein
MYLLVLVLRFLWASLCWRMSHSSNEKRHLLWDIYICRGGSGLNTESEARAFYKIRNKGKGTLFLLFNKAQVLLKPHLHMLLIFQALNKARAPSVNHKFRPDHPYLDMYDMLLKICLFATATVIRLSGNAFEHFYTLRNKRRCWWSWWWWWWWG